MKKAEFSKLPSGDMEALLEGIFFDEDFAAMTKKEMVAFAKDHWDEIQAGLNAGESVDSPNPATNLHTGSIHNHEQSHPVNLDLG